MTSPDAPHDAATGPNDAELRQAMMATSRAILAKQLRTERQLQAARESLRQQNEELSSTNAILTATLDATPLGVIACSLQGRVGRTNRRLDEMFTHEGRIEPGLALDVVASVLGERLHGTHDLRRWIDTVLAEPERQHAMEVTTPDGRHLQCRAVPQRVGDACVGVVLNWSDNTEQVHGARLRAEAAAALRASVEKSDFMSRASHELRTPLNAVCGFSQLLALNPRVQADPAALRQVGLINVAGNHLAALVDDLMQLSRVETGQLQLRDEAVDLAACAREVIALIALEAEQRQVQLFVDVPTTALVRGDRTRVRQVLLNLVSNGVKYNRPGGTVQLTVRGADAAWAAAVRDTGVGLSPEQQAHLYEPFNRLGAERLHVEGTGLGLTISRHLVLAMKGTLHMDSTVGVGSCFTLTLPTHGHVH
jgi:signal transduction histidine kinase